MPMFSWLKKRFGGHVPAPAAEARPPAVLSDEDVPTVSDPAVGYYVDPRARDLPTEILPGHGALMLHGLQGARLRVDGIELGDPQGELTGFFNVPPGPHTVVVEHGERRSAWTFVLAPNATLVRRCDWTRGGLVEVDVDLDQQQRDQLRSGALRPWPLASLFFQSAPEHVTIDGAPVPAEATRAFFGVTGLAPGEHRLRLGDADLSLQLPGAARLLLICGPAGPEVQDGPTSTMLIRVLMMHAPREALWPLAAFAANPPEPLQPSPAAPAPEPVPAGPIRFGDADLEQLRAAFSRLQADYAEDTIAEYVETLRRHDIQDREMAVQAEYFTRYTVELHQQVEALPRITASQAMTHLRYLSEDLQDTGVAALATLGRKLSAALDKASAAAG